MVYGYYTVSLKTVQASELPEEIPVEPGTTFRYGIKLAHLLFIPFFPLGKQWTMRRDGYSYEITPEAETLFEALYGTPKTPWYAFSGLILIGLFFLYSTVDGMISSSREKAYLSEMKKEKQDEKIRGLKNPLVSDFYALKSSKGRYYGVKVDSTAGNQVWLRCITNDQGYGTHTESRIVSKYLIDKDRFFTATVPKTSLLKSYQSKKPLLKIKGLANQQPLTLVEVYNRDIHNKNTDLAIQDSETATEVAKALRQFINTNSIDSSLVMMDSSSKKYFADVLAASRKKEVTQIKQFIKASPHSSVTYALVMYAKYSYSKSLGKTPAKDMASDIKTFSFFSKLLGMGLWTMSDKIKKYTATSARLARKNTATVILSLPSNILERISSISFKVHFTYEKGKWKIDLPSTFSYTENQIAKVGTYGNGPSLFRQKVREDLKEINAMINFDAELMY
jgi:hypothetical protein